MAKSITVQITEEELNALRIMMGLESEENGYSEKSESLLVVIKKIAQWESEMNPTVLAWIPRYRPFIMGGDVHQPAKAELVVEEMIDLGRGFFAAKVKAPNGKDFYVETVCGAFLGDDLNMILEDVKQGNVAVMWDQINRGTIQRDKAELINSDPFWSYVKGSGMTRRVI